MSYDFIVLSLTFARHISEKSQFQALPLPVNPGPHPAAVPHQKSTHCIHTFAACECQGLTNLWAVDLGTIQNRTFWHIFEELIRVN